jgi:hypothetical protein
VPIGCLNSRELPVKAGESPKRHLPKRTRALAGDIGGEQETHVLLAMQKVEGSNPFSRLRKGLRLQVFFVVAVE